MRFFNMGLFPFDAYLQRSNVLQDNPNRCQVVRCVKIPEYMSNQNNDYFGSILRRLEARNLSSVQRLKLLMVLHFGIINSSKFYEQVAEFDFQSKNQYSEAPESSIEGAQSLSGQLGVLVRLYGVFLKKLCSISQIYEVIKQFQSRAELADQLTLQEVMEHVFVLLNLLKSTWQISRIVMFMGRYAKEALPVMIDFTVLFSQDLARVYNFILKIQKWLVGNFDSLPLDQERLAVSAIEEIYSARELVERFIYNKYFYKHISIETFKEVPVDGRLYASMDRQARSCQLGSSQVDIEAFESAYFNPVSQNQSKRSKIRQ